MCLLFHKWKPHYVIGSPWVAVMPMLNHSYWTNLHLVGYRCTRCGKRKGRC